MKRFASIILAATLLAVGSAGADDPLSRILERPYIPEGDAAAGKTRPDPRKAALHTITESELLAEMEKELVRQLGLDGKVRLTLGRSWDGIRVPEAWKLEIPELPIKGLSKSFLLRVRIVANERAWFDQQVLVEAQCWKPALVAVRKVESGQSLDPSCVVTKTIDVLLERQMPVPADVILEDQEVLQNLSEGKILTWKDITPMPMVRKGATVSVVASEGGMSISMKGIAMNTGGMGDAIMVRNEDTHKDFPARVVSKNTVRVSF
jgi:flagellar basal body P-ring formation protein FlgA